MLQGWVIVLASFLYLGILFAIAWYADRRADTGRSLIASPVVYALSLGVYCTTWTFYGSVGRAAASGIGFLPIYLGPTLLFALAGFVLHKMIRVAKANRITSIADFVASRYGKSQLLGGLVTVIAVIGVIPYIALQLKAVSNSFAILTSYPEIIMPATAGAVPLFQDSALYVAMILAAFTILFGTRHLDATERHEGMVAAIAVESVVKLAAFLAVGVFVIWGMHDGIGDIFAQAAKVPEVARRLATADSPAAYGTWGTLIFLSLFAALLLPRQFQIAVVENVDPSHLRRAVWMFPLYLFLINLFVLPVALAGLMHFQGATVDADTFVLTLPMAHQQEALALFVYIGGLSAATGMVIVETIALSTMVCNDLVMPVLLRLPVLGLAARADLSGLLLEIRRWAIAIILGLGYLYFRVAGEAYALVSIGLISFAAVAQFAPVVIGGLFWKGGTREGALAGLAAGFVLWSYTLLLPSFAKSGWLPDGFIAHGLFGNELLRPQHLFGLTGLDEITHCLVWSLLANLGAYIGVSLQRVPNVREARQATLFVGGAEAAGVSGWRGSAGVADLLPLAGRFLGLDRAQDAFTRHAQQRGLRGLEDLPADTRLVSFAETLLAGAIGSASARAMVASVVTEEPLGIDEVMNILDEASQVRAYTRELEQKSLELTRATNDLREANARLRELDRMKDDFISTVTHELRTPLTSIRAFSEMLQEDPKIDLAQRARFLGIIVSETVRLSRLINQILDLAKLESGRAEWTVAAVDVAEVVREAADSLAALFAEKHVALELDGCESGLVVAADRDRLMQVMVNLLSNALKFVPAEGGRVKVGAGGTASEVRVSVTDNGPGIQLVDQEVIFDKFRQGAGTTDVLTDKPQGTGLGLPISRQIIEYFNGRLWAESTPGAGACFVFTLPRQAGDNGKLPGGV
ncbi:sensor histidine kinase [Sulfuritalea hydrogenivorans]|uniref:histidine kinase n=1 Tax=Sulfuritalea hydrogenivorans sk43H TaxID=1223802 RepID=W0SH61_9PROT|nr:sensor histidine kinase [Sulfuritalea hydrogenivorans]MDK9712786.1 sensor histidine kinase [Sulfuritalea sp.]BAO30095.1 sensor signal transduction histidine kinase [Sulfuritalea hydrogenivorans sk43H]